MTGESGPVHSETVRESHAKPIADLIREAEQLYWLDPAKGLHLADTAIAMSQSATHTGVHAAALYVRGRNLAALERPYEALIALRESALLFASMADCAGQARSTSMQGVVLKRLGNYAEALEAYRNSLDLYERAGEWHGRAVAISNVGGVELELGNYRAAIDAFQAAIAIHREKSETPNQVAVNLNKVACAKIQMALCSCLQGNMRESSELAEESLAIVDQALALSRVCSMPRLEVAAMDTKVQAYQVLDRHEEAIALIDEMHRLAVRLGSKVALAHNRHGFSRSMLAKKEYARGIGSASEALDLFKALAIRKEIANCHRTISELFEGTGDAQGALAHLRTYIGLRDCLVTEESEQRARTLQTRAKLAKIQRESDQLRELALVDQLTGLKNRRFLENRITTGGYLEGMATSQVAITVADIDHFKVINDTFSHLVGDEVLRHIGRMLSTYCRASDHAIRLGGEEFLLVMPSIDLASAVAASERIREAVAQFQWKAVYPGLNVTISMGVAAGNHDRLMDLMKSADRNLYRAKRRGRNRTFPIP